MLIKGEWGRCLNKKGGGACSCIEGEGRCSNVMRECSEGRGSLSYTKEGFLIKGERTVCSGERVLLPRGGVLVKVERSMFSFTKRKCSNEGREGRYS